MYHRPYDASPFAVDRSSDFRAYLQILLLKSHFFQVGIYTV